MLIKEILAYFNKPTEVFISDTDEYYSDEYIDENRKYVQPTVGQDLLIKQGNVLVKSWENYLAPIKTGFKASNDIIFWKSPSEFRAYLNNSIAEFIFNITADIQNQIDPVFFINSNSLILSGFKELFQKQTIKNKEYIFYKNFKIIYTTTAKVADEDDVSESGIDFKSITNKNTLDILAKYTQELYSFLNELQNQFQLQGKSIQAQPVMEKLKSKLSVIELSLLFRLLCEENIVIGEHKTHIYRFIEHSFEAKKQDQISEKSIKNHFYSPTPAAIDKVKSLLTDLKIQLQQIENKKYK